MTKFIQALNAKGIFDGIRWGGSQTDDREALGVKKEAMLALNPQDKKEGYQRNTPEEYTAILKDTVFPRFAQQLEKAIKSNMSAFKEALRECEGNFLNEGGSADLSYEKVKTIKEAERRMARETISAGPAVGRQ